MVFYQTLEKTQHDNPASDIAKRLNDLAMHASNRGASDNVKVTYADLIWVGNY